MGRSQLVETGSTPTINYTFIGKLVSKSMSSMIYSLICFEYAPHKSITENGIKALVLTVSRRQCTDSFN